MVEMTGFEPVTHPLRYPALASGGDAPLAIADRCAEDPSLFRPKDALGIFADNSSDFVGLLTHSVAVRGLGVGKTKDIHTDVFCFWDRHSKWNRSKNLIFFDVFLYS